VATFSNQDLSGSRFERVDLTESEFYRVDLSRSRFRGVGWHGIAIRDSEFSNCDISAEIENVTINGVDIGPLIEAELNRRDPDRAAMRPSDAAGFRRAWDVIERRWSATVDQARQLAPEMLHESVDDEWSFIQTLRHLAFATDAWVRRAILGEPWPWDPLDLPWDDMDSGQSVPWDRDARPNLDEVLLLRADRMATVRAVIDGLSDESLDVPTATAVGPGWPPEGRKYPVRECLLIVLNEEWQHRVYAERDLRVLASRKA
jgi:hypothetical protein